MILRRAQLYDALDIAWWGLRIVLLCGAVLTLVTTYLAAAVKLFRAILNG